MTALMLFTRDLRIADNEALQVAAREQSLICGVWPQDTLNWGDSKRAFYESCLGNLAHSLQSLGHGLFIIDDASAFDTIYQSRSYNELEGPIADSDKIIIAGETTLFKEQELPFAVVDLAKTFTPFRHKMDKVAKEPQSPFTIDKLPPQAPYQGAKIAPSPQGGETEALARLEEYFQTDHPLSYFDTRNGLINKNDSTKFSPFLAWGCLSAERIYYELKLFEARRGSNKSTYWIFFELLWRDYFKFLSLKFGSKMYAITGTADRQLPALDAELEQQYFLEWVTATTEEPFVNANMRELNQTGWMSNRGRQNVASFLCKTKGVNWLLGAEYFARHLIDYDLESNYGNWAYLAGVGVDPRDRLFNIAKQASIYDPDNVYQDLWLSQ